MKQLKAVIVEDSRLARNELKELLKEYKEIVLEGEAENVDEGFELITQKNPDLLFLDINMPEKDGFELLEMLDEVPTTIFTTAFDEYAIKSFEYNAFDYLLKPINPKRFAKTIEKIVEEYSKNDSKEEKTANKLSPEKQIFIKEGERCWLVKIKDITLFEIVGNYTRVFFEDNKPLIYKSLAQIEEKLPEALFFRANRQQIININHVKKVVAWFNGKLKIEMQSGEEIEISRRQSYIFKERLSF
ncbi:MULTISPECIES: LytR/AlgR family response regulator transcription factor [unclassified Tenacibaculum]|uniref:LytR/AlgR family response regulator transcription factor n=1 Tax=unclassified Tenacibaculum TaxID=2635139 RepID=UPI001F1D391A|nr:MULTISPECIES: LytTR family transcriptional regulator DNA-binding domain-containing protein [unclassified Tenacibaculum]MCF2873323.1 LytTR family transcriptional regulator DNA-binding domain-containing protein [Tenacibaculum sp. Cn5-1]MCF2933479.1 LytTR family transcriptional regulator DNA-binding domain-containing protein [Tenacibaculum sp. Cn5-34]MCG7509939.1 LytTR family transcriptional regulator DNA-binding domain-containing protein [Tenacibaculum sp. Cn5-46]